MHEPEAKKEKDPIVSVVLTEDQVAEIRKIAALYVPPGLRTREMVVCDSHETLRAVAREFHEAWTAVEEGTVSFDLHNDAVTRLEAADAALRALLGGDQPLSNDDEIRQAGFRGYDDCPEMDCPTPFLCSERGDCDRAGDQNEETTP